LASDHITQPAFPANRQLVAIPYWAQVGASQYASGIAVAFTATFGWPLVRSGYIVGHSLCAIVSDATSGQFDIEVRLDDVEVTQLTLTLLASDGTGTYTKCVWLPNAKRFAAKAKVQVFCTETGTMQISNAMGLVWVVVDD